MRVRANDPGTFVGNREYHLEEGAEMSRMAPSLAVKTGQRPLFHAEARGHCCTCSTDVPSPRLGYREAGARGSVASKSP